MSKSLLYDLEDMLSELRVVTSKSATMQTLRRNDQKKRTMRRTGCNMNDHGNPIDDTHVLIQKSDVVLGSYSLDEWVTTAYARSAIEQNKSTFITEGTWLVPNNWCFLDWVKSVSEKFNFMSATRAMIMPQWGLIEASFTRGKLQLEINGVVEDLEVFVQSLNAQFKRAENLVEWVYGERGQSVAIPLNYRPAIQSAYPWLPAPLNEYIDGYLDSDASVLILIGPPGTGKTTFIKNIIHRSKSDAKVTYDQRVMSGDGLFAQFIEDDSKFLIMEDADAFLRTRTDGNSMMHRFLNVSDGLISAADKKLVFSTNLPSIREVDEALMRPGRCYDVITFRALMRAEALNVAEELGVTLPDGAEFTLAEICNHQPSSTPCTRRMGFY